MGKSLLSSWTSTVMVNFATICLLALLEFHIYLHCHDGIIRDNASESC